MAGAMTEQFRACLAEKYRVHDMWHILSNAASTNIANALRGHVPPVVPAGSIVDGVSMAAAANLHECATLGEACTDRWPPRAAYISALILGVASLYACVTELLSKRQQGPNVAVTLMELTLGLEDSWFQANLRNDRHAMLEMKFASLAMICLSIGVNEAMASTRDWLEEHPSLYNLRLKDTTSYLHGKTLGRTVAQMQTDPAAALAALSNFSAAA